jgi:GNAT superfamily N-acetyltransferase
MLYGLVKQKVTSKFVDPFLALACRLHPLEVTLGTQRIPWFIVIFPFRGPSLILRHTRPKYIYILIYIYIFHLEISPLISAFHIFHPPTLKQKRHNAQGVEKEYPHLALARLSGLRPWRVVASPALRGRGFGQKALELLERHVRCHDLDGKRLKSPKLVEDG